MIPLDLGQTFSLPGSHERYKHALILLMLTFASPSGITAGKVYGESGGGTNILCLPESPQYSDYQYPQGSHPERAYIYSAGYRIFDYPPLEDKLEQEVPCVVCHSYYRRTFIMIPAVKTCPTAWTGEYSGYLMAARYSSFESTEYVCIDVNSETRPDVSRSSRGAYFHPVEARCTPQGNLDCSTYIPGTVMTCVVCTK